MTHKLKLDIKGMHCRSCEILLEQNISKVPGVKKVRTDYRNGAAFIESNTSNPPIESIRKAVLDAGYDIGRDDKKHFFSRNVMDYWELGLALAIILILYMFLSSIGFF